MTPRKTIGVLALQGDFEAHEKVLERIGAKHIQIRKPADLNGIDGLIIPGGESTTLIKLMCAFNLIEPIKAFHEQGKPVFGTCAGAILLANAVTIDQFQFGFIDITVERNGYGRQIRSFEEDVTVPVLGPEPMHAVFIRAPKILTYGKHVTVLAEINGCAVAAKEKNILVSTFHPELGDDSRMHEYFIGKFIR